MRADGRTLPVLGQELRHGRLPVLPGGEQAAHAGARADHGQLPGPAVELALVDSDEGRCSHNPDTSISRTHTPMVCVVCPGFAPDRNPDTA